MEEKGLSEVLNLLDNYGTSVVSVLIDTILLPFRFLQALLQ